MKKPLLIILSVFSMSYGALAQTTCNPPVITEVKGAGSYCPGAEATLTLTGTLNNATTWTWYSDSCGGASVGTGTSIKVKVYKTTTYFVRGTGGCVGTTATCTSVVVRRDDVGPVVSLCPKDTLVANTVGQCGAIVSFNVPKGVDSCSDTVYVKRVAGLAPGSFFPVGVTEVKYELSDTIGNVSVCSFKVTVADEELPVITCVENIEANNDPGECGAIVTYEVPVGTDNCPNAVTNRTAGLGSGAFFPVGVTKETYMVTDAAGNVDSCSFTITVKDVELPVITLKQKETTRLWPVNHKHHEIVIEDYIESVSDNCGGITIEDVIIDEIGSDEPNNGKGDGNTTDDIVISAGCDTTKLLAERAGKGNGRVYVVTLAVKDLHDNIGTAEFIVEVPHDMSKKNSTVRDSLVYVKNGCDLETDTTTTDSVAVSSSKVTESGRVTQEVSVYPNPFTGSFSVTFTAKVNDRVKVEVYNMIGMKVAELIEQNVETGKSYEWTFDKPTLNSNDYLLIVRGTRTQQVVRLLQKR
jgi:HYR domain/Ig-like domain CHU_C associated/Secretion system C-terminal sorting domain